MKATDTTATNINTIATALLAAVAKRNELIDIIFDQIKEADYPNSRLSFLLEEVKTNRLVTTMTELGWEDCPDRMTTLGNFARYSLFDMGEEAVMKVLKQFWPNILPEAWRYILPEYKEAMSQTDGGHVSDEAIQDLKEAVESRFGGCELNKLEGHGESTCEGGGSWALRFENEYFYGSNGTHCPADDLWGQAEIWECLPTSKPTTPEAAIVAAHKLGIIPDVGLFV